MSAHLRMTTTTRLVLRALAGGRAYGYDIHRATGLQSGTVYPILARLVAHGLATVTEETERTPGRPPRRYYQLTQTGQKTAEQIGVRL